MKDIIAFTLQLFMVSLMMAYPVLSNYRRHLLARSKTLYALKHHRNHIIGAAVIAMITGGVTLFWILVGLVSALRGVEIGPYGWVLILAAVVFFGHLTFLLSPVNAKTIFTEEGIISTSGNFFWRRIADYTWEPYGKNQYSLFLVIRCSRVKMPLPVRGLLAGSADVKAITQIMEQHLKGAPGGRQKDCLTNRPMRF